jgi:transcription-repair coupling factor (superfamily II helicase)
VQVTQVLSPGEFAVRGSVVDLFAAGAPQPFRLDLFDDQIESVRVFDPADQRSGARLAAVPLLPAREIPSSPEAIAEFRARWRERFEGDPQKSSVYRAVTAGQMPAGIEAWLPLFFRETSSLCGYLPAGCVIVDLVDLDRTLAGSWSEIEARVRGPPPRPRTPVAAAGRCLRAGGRCPLGARPASTNTAHAGQGRADRRHDGI